MGGLSGIVLEEREAQLAAAKAGEQAHPVFSRVRRSVLDPLSRFLAADYNGSAARIALNCDREHLP